MDEKKKHRQALRRRLQHAEYVINRRNGWPHGTAQKMAREKCDAICAEISQLDRRKKESQSNVTTD